MKASAIVPAALTNHNGYYTAEVSMGSNKQKLNLDFDTGSPWLTAMLDSCTNCNSPDHFTPSASSTFSQVGTSTSYKEEYGSGEASSKVIGMHATDQVCIGDTACTPKFEFFGVLS